jgi:hypothetical protein
VCYEKLNDNPCDDRVGRCACDRLGHASMARGGGMGGHGSDHGGGANPFIMNNGAETMAPITA